MSVRRFRAPRSVCRFAFSASAFALSVAQTACGARAPATGPPGEVSLRAPAPGPSLSAARLDAAIAAARDYLVRHTSGSGRFTYVIDSAGRERSARYNVLRHGGTVYALAELYSRRPDPEVAAAITRAGRYLVRRHVAAGPAPDTVAIWSRPGEELSGDTRQVKLGGLGLGLVALVAAREIDASAVPVDTLRGIGRMIAAMQRADGSFHSKMEASGEFDREFVSLYYPGEAILGLVRLYRIDPDRRWLEIAGRGVRHLIESRADIGERDLPADHWLLIAIGELAALIAEQPDAAGAAGVSVEAALAGARRIAREILGEQQDSGSFGSHRRSTPTATRLEGLIALVAALPPDDPARPPMVAAIRSGVGFLLGCQVDGSGRRAGGIVRRCPPDDGDRDAEIRIDYVQHALSAFLGARQLLWSNRP